MTIIDNTDMNLLNTIHHTIKNINNGQKFYNLYIYCSRSYQT